MNKKLFKKLLTSAIALGAVATPAVVFGQDYDTLIGSTEAQINGLTAAQSELYAQLTASYAKLNEVKSAAATAQATVEENDKTIAQLESEIKDLEAAIAKREVLLADQARAVQSNGGATNYATIVASSKSVSEFVGRTDVVRKMVSANKNLLTQQKADKEAVEAKKASVETVRAENVQKQVELEKLKGALVAEQETNESVYNQLTSDLTLAQGARDALVAEKASYEAHQAELQAAAQAEAEAAAVAQQQAAAQQQVAQEQQQVATETTQVVEAAETTTESSSAQEVAPEQLDKVEAPETSVVEATTRSVVEQPEATQQPVEEASTEQPQQEAPVAQETAPAVEETTPVVEEEEAPQAEASVTYGSAYGDVLSTAAKYVGTPYVWGGKSPSGFDCSGFVQYVFREAYGIDVGGWTVPQESAGTRISVSEAQAGDLYFWGDAGSTYHVAIATGDGGFIHASQPGSPLGYGNTAYYTPSFAVRVR